MGIDEKALGDIEKTSNSRPRTAISRILEKKKPSQVEIALRQTGNSDLVHQIHGKVKSKFLVVLVDGVNLYAVLPGALSSLSNDPDINYECVLLSLYIIYSLSNTFAIFHSDQHFVDIRNVLEHKWVFISEKMDTQTFFGYFQKVSVTVAN